MDEAGYADSLIQSFDASLTGIALSGSFYGYETRDGWKEDGISDVSNPQQSLQALKQTLDGRDSGGDSHEITDAVKKQLRDLGYA